MGDVKRPDRVNGTAISARRREVAALALACATQQQIATALGVAKGTVCMDLQALRQEWRQESVADLDALILREAQSLDKMESEAAAQWAASQEPHWLDLRLKIKARRSRLLGLDAPSRAEIAGPGGQPISIREVVVELPPEPEKSEPVTAPSAPVPAPANGFLDVVVELAS